MKPATLYDFPRSLVTYKKGKIYKSEEGITLSFKEIFPYLSTRTQSNLELFTKFKQIVWEKAWVFFVPRRRRRYPKGKKTGIWVTTEVASILIEGKNKGKKGIIVYQYWRKETKSCSAGQTLLYTEGKRPKQAMRYIGNMADAHAVVKRTIKKKEALEPLLTHEDKFVRIFAKEEIGEQNGSEVPN